MALTSIKNPKMHQEPFFLRDTIHSTYQSGSVYLNFIEIYKELYPYDTVHSYHNSFYLFSLTFAQFKINRARFSLLFSTYVKFCTEIVVLYLFLAFSSANVFS